jgi:hypothetical protein
MTSRNKAAQEETTWSDEVRKFLFQLQNEALSALPAEKPSDVALTMAGKRIAQDVKWLRL